MGLNSLKLNFYSEAIVKTSEQQQVKAEKSKALIQQSEKSTKVNKSGEIQSTDPAIGEVNLSKLKRRNPKH